MRGELILNAYSSNSGGGRSGLVSLIKALPSESRAIIFIDQRFVIDFEFPRGITFERVAPTILGRFLAERKIRSLARAGRWLLRLGSVPPFFNLGVPTFVFFENRFLLRHEKLTGMPLRRRLRIYIERLLIDCFKSHVTQFIVQSPSMATGLRASLGAKTPITILPFQAGPTASQTQIAKKYDFIYVASGDPHKNHSNLVAAWCLLAKEGARPSLALTLSETQDHKLLELIAVRKSEFAVDIRNLPLVAPEQVSDQYRSAGALIFPSVCESYGRPLREAADLGLPILAAELDYVRDLIDPEQTFDPTSPVSIARAVRRFLKQNEVRARSLSPSEFLERLKKL